MKGVSSVKTKWFFISLVVFTCVLLLAIYASARPKFSRSQLERRLRVGMTKGQVEATLGIGPLVRAGPPQQNNYMVQSPTWQSWVLPQDEIWISFDRENRLQEGYGATCYFLSERHFALHLKRL